jgi:hypothetical protein
MLNMKVKRDPDLDALIRISYALDRDKRGKYLPAPIPMHIPQKVFLFTCLIGSNDLRLPFLEKLCELVLDTLISRLFESLHLPICKTDYHDRISIFGKALFNINKEASGLEVSDVIHPQVVEDMIQHAVKNYEQSWVNDFNKIAVMDTDYPAETDYPPEIDKSHRYLLQQNYLPCTKQTYFPLYKLQERVKDYFIKRSYLTPFLPENDVDDFTGEHLYNLEEQVKNIMGSFPKESDTNLLEIKVNEFTEKQPLMLQVPKNRITNKALLIAAPVLILLGLEVITSISQVVVANLGGGVSALAFLALSFSKLTACLLVGSVMVLGLGLVRYGGFFAKPAKESLGVSEISHLEKEANSFGL